MNAFADRRVPARSRAAAVIDIGEKSLLFHAGRRELFELNAPARAIWDEIDGATPIAVIAHRVARRFGADRNEVSSGVLAAVEQFAETAAIGGAAVPAVAASTDAVVVPAGALCFAAVDASFAITGSHAEVIGGVAQLLGPLRIRDRSPIDVLIRIDSCDGGCRIDVGGDVSYAADSSAAIGLVLSSVNLLGARGSPASVRFHAGGIVIGGRSVLLPAPSGSGKSTLTCALVQRGAGYLSDEMIGVAAGGRIIPYPKAITLDAAAAALFPGLAAVEAAGELHAVMPAFNEPGAVDLIVSPRYERGRVEPLVERLGQAAALRVLLDNSMDFAATGGAGFELIGDLCRSVPAYSIVYGALADACAAVEELVGRSDESRRSARTEVAARDTNAKRVAFFGEQPR